MDINEMMMNSMKDERLLRSMSVDDNAVAFRKWPIWKEISNLTSEEIMKEENNLQPITVDSLYKDAIGKYLLQCFLKVVMEKSESENENLNNNNNNNHFFLLKKQLRSNNLTPILNQNELKKNVLSGFMESKLYDMFLKCKCIETKYNDKDLIGTNIFETMRVLGRGAFGKVFACKKKNVGKLYAMKLMNIKRVFGSKSIKSVLAEKYLLSCMDGNRFVTSLKYAYVDSENFVLIMDLMTGGDLKYRLKIDSKFSERRTRFYGAQVLLGLEHLHSQRIVFRDLKLENILLDKHGHCKISDLGLASVLPSCGYTKGYGGTPGYIAPEMVKGKEYDVSVDFFSLGVLIYRCLSGTKPFAAKSVEEIDNNAVNIEPSFEPAKYFSVDAKSVIEGLIKKNPMERLGGNGKGCEEIKHHPWFWKDIDFELLKEGKIKPPYVPSSAKINAPDQMDIGEVKGDKQYEEIEIDIINNEKYSKTIKEFPFVSSTVIANEILNALDKVHRSRVNTKKKTWKGEEKYLFPSVIVKQHNEQSECCILL